MRLTLLFLLCLGCASGSEYQRGTYRQPVRAPARAPATNPTTDAPRYAPPGQTPTPGMYPRGPHTRVLPQTPETRKEPGIWAATPSGGGDVAYVLYEPMHAPTVDDKQLADERSHIMRCGWEINELVRTIRPETYISGMDSKVRACLAHMLMERCFDRREESRTKRGRRENRPPGASHANALLSSARASACDEPNTHALAAREVNALNRESGGAL